MLNDLQNIKEALFDAPGEVKAAFNTLVKYFDDNKVKLHFHKYRDLKDDPKVNRILSGLFSYLKEDYINNRKVIYSVDSLKGTPIYFVTNNGSLSTSRYNVIICLSSDQEELIKILRKYWHQDRSPFKLTSANEKVGPECVAFGVDGGEW